MSLSVKQRFVTEEGFVGVCVGVVSVIVRATSFPGEDSIMCLK